MSQTRSCRCSAGWRHRAVSRAESPAGLRLGFAVLGGDGGEKSREVAPAIGDGFDRGAADRERLVAHLLLAEALIKEARRVVAQYPDDRRAAPGRDEPPEQRDQQLPPDALVLPVR